MAWHDWVTNGDVQRSAVQFILSQLPSAKEAVDTALEANDAQTLTLAWLVVADIAEAVKGRSFPYRQILPKNNWTSVLAMPLRLAKKLGDRNTRWTPALPEPLYMDPEKSERVLFVDPDNTSALDL